MPDDHAVEAKGSEATAVIAEIEDFLDELVMRTDGAIPYEVAAREWWATFKSEKVDARKFITPAMFEKMLRVRVRQIEDDATETQAARAAAAEAALKDRHIETQGVPIEQNFTDRFAEAHKDMLRHNGTRGEWMWWDGARWRPDAHNLHLDLARRFTGKIAEQAIAVNNKVMLSFASRNRFAEAILRFAIGHPKLSSVETDYDADPYLLNTPEGTLRPAYPAAARQRAGMDAVESVPCRPRLRDGDTDLGRLPGRELRGQRQIETSKGTPQV